jgi:hypothetical protein
MFGEAGSSKASDISALAGPLNITQVDRGFEFARSN